MANTGPDGRRRIEADGRYSSDDDDDDDSGSVGLGHGSTDGATREGPDDDGDDSDDGDLGTTDEQDQAAVSGDSGSDGGEDDGSSPSTSTSSGSNQYGSGGRSAGSKGSSNDSGDDSGSVGLGHGSTENATREGPDDDGDDSDDDRLGTSDAQDNAATSNVNIPDENEPGIGVSVSDSGGDISNSITPSQLNQIDNQTDRDVNADDLRLVDGDLQFSREFRKESQPTGRPRPTNQQSREDVATSKLESQLEEDLNRDVEPGEDFTVQKTDDGYRASPTESLEREMFNEQLMKRDDVDSKDDYTISEDNGKLQAEIEPQRKEESFIEGLFSGADNATAGAVETFENTTNIEVPGEGAVLTTTDTGSPDDISGAARDAVGVENTTSVAEATDEKLGQTDDQIRQDRKNVSSEITDPNQGVDVAANVIEFFDGDRETPEAFEKRGVTDSTVDVTGTAVPGASAIGPGGAAKGAIGGSRLLASSDALKAAGITGTAAGVGIASGEIEIPEDNEQGELETTESVTSSEVGVPDGSASVTSSEIGVPEDQATQTELSVPDQTSGTDDVVVTTSPVLQGQVGKQTEEVEENDDLGVPDEPFRESDRRLYDPGREFGDQEDVSRSVDPTRDENPSDQDIGSGISGTGNSFEPSRGQTVEESFNQWMEEQRQLEEDAQQQQVLERNEAIGRGSVIGSVADGGAENAVQSRIKQSQEQQATAGETSNVDRTGQRSDELLSPFEDTDQRNDVFEEQSFDESPSQDKQFENTDAETFQSDTVLNNVVTNSTEPVADQISIDTSFGTSYPELTRQQYNPPRGPGPNTGRPGGPSRIPLPDFDGGFTSQSSGEVDVSDKIFDTGVIQSLDELDNDDDGLF